MTHTPGPWTADRMLVVASNGREVTHTGILGRRWSSHEGQCGGDEDVDNATLLAASPAMLEELEAVAEWMERHALPALGDDSDGGNAILASIELTIAKARRKRDDPSH